MKSHTTRHPLGAWMVAFASCLSGGASGITLETAAAAAPPASESPSPLRSAPATLTPQQAKLAIAAHGFYCKVWNESGGTRHDFQRVVVGGALVVVDAKFRLMWLDSLPSFAVDLTERTETTLFLSRDQARAFVSLLDAKAFAGFRDWRLPTLEEAMSLTTRAEDAIPVNSRRGLKVLESLSDSDSKVIHLSPVFDWSVAPVMWTADLWSSDDPRALERSGLGISATGWTVDLREGEPQAAAVNGAVPVRAVRSLSP